MSLKNNKRKGSRFETRTAERPASPTGLPVERRHLNGVNDKGDPSGVTADGNGVVIEWRNTSRMNVAEHLREAAREAENAGASIDVVIQHRAGIGIETDEGMDRQLVFMTLADFAEILNIRNGRKLE